jgi:hypothetical protein
MVQYQSIDKFAALLVQTGENTVEKQKLINKLIETLRQIKSKSCCTGLINMLVKSTHLGIIDFKYLIDTFLRLINSKSENSTLCIPSLTQLLVANRAFCIKYYSIRNPSHPFIEILRNSNEFKDNLGTLLLKQLEHLFVQLEASEATLLMKPFFIHVFLDKQPYKHLIAKFLNKSRHHSNTKPLLNLYITFLRNDEMGDSRFLELLNDYITRFTDDDKEVLLNSIDLTRYLIKIDRCFNYDCSIEWRLMQKLNKRTVKLNFAEQNKLVELLAENLNVIGNVNLEAFIEFVKACLESFDQLSKLSLASFLPSLFSYIMSFGSIQSIHTIADQKSSIESLISLIEIKLRSKLSVEDKLITSDSNSLFNLCDYENADSLSSSDSNECVRRRKFNCLGALFLLNDSDLGLSRRTCHFFKLLVTKWPQLYSTCFSLYLYKMKTSNNLAIISFLIKNLADLSSASNKCDIGLCLNVLNSLLDSSQHSDEMLCIKLVCMQEMSKLCTKYNYDHLVYPLLSKELLVSTKLDQYSNLQRLEVLYTKAFCIFEIISHRPDYYAKELLGIINCLLRSSRKIF